MLIWSISIFFLFTLSLHLQTNIVDKRAGFCPAVIKIKRTKQLSSAETNVGFS